ncbi:MAG: 4-alpha-glucanotransferase [Deltaproteobacteria bacterium]|nr:4-alpha-glucanotransferase [Deltaproteobacteria bacterium]
MADNQAAPEIAALGRLCGIAPEYCDNFGHRHPTSPDTFKALLTAMGVPWEAPERRREEIACRRLGPWSRLLSPVQVCGPDSPEAILAHFFTPAADLPSPLRLSAALTAESGQKVYWQEDLSGSKAVASRAVPGGFRHRLGVRIPEELALGYYDLQLRVEAGSQTESGRTRLIVAPKKTYQPECLADGRRLWGFNLPLYALRSAVNWGIGDFRDLKAVTAWAASLGAAFVGVNPLHARSALPESDPSPYSPTSRLFYNLLYLNLDEVPEVQLSPEVQVLLASQEFQAAKEELRQGPVVPYGKVFGLKYRALELLFQAFRQHHGLPEAPITQRGREFAGFIQAKGESLRMLGTFCALTKYFEVDDWRRWPPEYQDPHSAAVTAFAGKQQLAICFYQYGHWLAATQLREVTEAAHQQGLPFSLYQDLALGVEAAGFDTWAYPNLFAKGGVTIGAPPDAFSPRGQNWGIPPIIPQALRESGYQLLIDTIRAVGPAGGMLRLDHVMWLFRLLWIPAGMEAMCGTYVHYPARELLAVLALESMRRRLLIIGEDLGTVTPRVRRELARAGIFSYRVFYFERNSAGRFLAPEQYPVQAVAAVTTHDLPTLTGFWEGRDLIFKRDAGLYANPLQAGADAADRQQDRLRLVEALQNRGLLESPGPPLEPESPCPPEVREGVLEYLAQSPAALMEVRLEEVFGLTEQQNFPGTQREHPNWRRRIPVSMEEMVHDPNLIKWAMRLNKYRRNQACQ